MAKTDEIDEERWAVENVRLSDGARVRVIECFGQAVAKSVMKSANAIFEKDKRPYRSEIIKC